MICPGNVILTLAHIGRLDYHIPVEPNTIAIQLADRSFFPIMDIRKAGRRRVTLAAGQAEQAHIEINLFRIPEAGAPAVQIGSLFLSDISDTSDSDAIQLDLSLDDEGNLSATVTEKVTGNSASRLLSVWETPEAFITDPQSDTEEETSYIDAGEVALQQRTSRREVGITALVVLLLLLIATAGLVAYVWWQRSEDVSIPLQSSAAREVVITPTFPILEEDQEPTEQGELEPISEPAELLEPSEPAPTLELPVATPETERAYRILRGDTLWDISDRFYGTPWRFSELARRNQIRDPNVIFPEDQLIIPEK